MVRREVKDRPLAQRNTRKFSGSEFSHSLHP